MEGPYKFLLADQARFGDLAGGPAGTSTALPSPMC